MNATVAEGFSAERLGRVRPFIESYIQAGRHFGAECLIARHGRIAFHQALGYRDARKSQPLEKGAVYSIFSVSKTFTSVLALHAIEAGRFSLTTKVSEIIPELSGGRRANITVYHLLTHQAGLPMSFMVGTPGGYIDRMDDMVAAVCKSMQCEAEPGDQATYSPMANHLLLGELVRRTDAQQRSFRDIMNQELIEPLQLRDTAVGLRGHLRPRHVKPVWMFDKGPLKHLGRSNYGDDGAFEEEDAEMPWVGIATTVSDLFRLAEMLRRGGELDGARVLSCVTTEQMKINRTGEKINQLHGRNAILRGWDPMPAYSGLGVFLRGTAVCHHQFGVFTSPQTFGQHGMGSALYWVDPLHQVTFVFLSHGVMDEATSVERFQRLSDIVITSIV